MSLDNLANELLLFVADSLDSVHDLSALTRTSRRFFHLFINRLYLLDDMRGKSLALDYAVRHNRPDILQRAMNAGAQNMTLNHLETAARLGHADYTYQLLDSLNTSRREQQAHISTSVIHKTQNIVRLLLSSPGIIEDFRFFPRVRSASTPLHAATRGGRVDIMEALVELDKSRNAEKTEIEHNFDRALYQACRDGFIDGVRLMLQEGASPNFHAQFGCSTLAIAAKYNHFDVAKLLLGAGARIRRIEEENDYDDTSRSALRFAASHSDLRLFKLFMEALEVSTRSGTHDPKGTDESICPSRTPYENFLNSPQDRDGHSFLHNAAACANSELSVMLLARGADVNAADGDGNTPLHLGAHYLSHVDEVGDIFQVLIDHGANVNARNQTNETPLISAACCRLSYPFMKLVSHGASIDVVDEFGRTLLHRSESAEVATYLIHHGADVNAKDCQGLTPLHTAGSQPVSVLIENGAQVNATDPRGDTPLHGLMSYSRPLKEMSDSRPLEVAHHLLKAGADVRALNRLGETPLALALSRYNPPEELVSLLVKHGSDVNATYDGQSILFMAVGLEYSDGLIELLLEEGADPTFCFVQDDMSFSILERALEPGICTARKIQLLLDHGADPTAMKSERVGALSVACLLDYSPKCLEALLRHGSDVNELDVGNKTPLMHAVEDETTLWLLDHGADVNAEDLGGRQALQEAAEEGMDSTMEILLNHGADIDHRDFREGETALHSACLSDHLSTVRILLQRGADVSIKDAEGKTALFWAALTPNPSICRLLKRFGARFSGADIRDLRDKMEEKPSEFAYVAYLMEREETTRTEKKAEGTEQD